MHFVHFQLADLREAIAKAGTNEQLIEFDRIVEDLKSLNLLNEKVCRPKYIRYYFDNVISTFSFIIKTDTGPAIECQISNQIYENKGGNEF